MNKTRKFGLLEEDINRIVSILMSNPNIENAILFGSRAKGNYKPGSDIDVALNGSNLTLDDILSAKIEIEKLALPYKFDILIYDRITEKALIEHIERVGIILFQR